MAVIAKKHAQVITPWPTSQVGWSRYQNGNLMGQWVNNCKVCAFSKLGFDTAPLLKKNHLEEKDTLLVPQCMMYREMSSLHWSSEQRLCLVKGPVHLFWNTYWITRPWWIFWIVRVGGGTAAPKGNPHRSRENIQTAPPTKVVFCTPAFPMNTVCLVWTTVRKPSDAAASVETVARLSQPQIQGVTAP